MHQRLNGSLAPKDNEEFKRSPEYGRAEWGNATCGHNDTNAAIEHQQHQAGYPTSGISTTPIMGRAKVYATRDGQYDHGYIYVIDRNLCAEYEVSVYVVSEVVPKPYIPEDEEVILVASEFGALPTEIIVDVFEFDT